jgi:hypothetical protein
MYVLKCGIDTVSGTAAMFVCVCLCRVKVVVFKTLHCLHILYSVEWRNDCGRCMNISVMS